LKYSSGTVPEEDRMTRKKATAVAAEPELDEEQLAQDAYTDEYGEPRGTDAEEPVEVGHGEEPLEEMPGSIPVALFKCTNHTERFPDEPQFMLPLEGFPLTVEGKRRGVYCRRCQGKLHTAYGQRKREAARNSVERLRAIVEKKRAELAEAEQQLLYIEDLERDAAERRAAE
jgi:hypothetical protein